MGRPIRKQFFGNTITPYQNHAVGGKTGVGGEGFSSLVLLNGGSTTYYSTTTAVTWLASAPQITGGVAATGTASVSAAGKITALNISKSGTGYTSTGSVTVVFSPATTGTAATYTVVLTSGRQNAISFASRLTGGSSRTNGDILKQEGSHRYLIQNTDGKGICKLVAKASGSLLGGEMNIIATDNNGNTYYVTKLTARKVRLVRAVQNGVSAWLVADGGVSGWTISGATATRVSIAHTV